MKLTHALLIVLIACLLSFTACENNDSRTFDEDGASEIPEDPDVDDDTFEADDDLFDDDVLDDDATDDDVIDDDATDDDTQGDDDTLPDDDTFTDDDTGDDDTFEPPEVTNEARANGFKLFYRERVSRLLLAWNRFGLVGDAAWGANIMKHAIAKDGNVYEVVAGETDNNHIGISIWNTWHAYKHLGGRDAELTLMRQFEGLRFYQAASGYNGLTSREVMPGWTRVMDGVANGVSRTRFGEPYTPPWLYSTDLENEILNSFYDGIVVTYRENPLEYYYTFKPVNELAQFAVTYVFSDPPNFLHISNCCGSWKINDQSEWAGAFWGNHNSRDNFPDMALGFLTAMDAVDEAWLPEDVRATAENAVEDGHIIGDRIVSDDFIQMTIDEYGELTPGGQVRPDGRTEWQDLGSFASCPMVYLAQALSTEGLDVPIPDLPMPGALETSALRQFFILIGLPNFPLPVIKCHSIDDAFIGLTWAEMMSLEIFGEPWYEIAFIIGEIFPELFPELLGSTGDDFKEMELGVMAICYYAELTGKKQLLRKAKQSLQNLIDLHQILAQLVYHVAASPYRTGDPQPYIDLIESTEEHLYVSAILGRLYGIDTPYEDLDNFSRGESHNSYLESILNLGDTSYWPLKTDDEIMNLILAELAHKESWIVDRYWERFPDAPPVRRAGDGYEAINAVGEWQAVENPRHAWFSANSLMFETALCTNSPWTLSCEWAALGCERPDLDGSGTVDAADRALFDTAYATYSGQECNEGNDWCEGADLNRSGFADEDDLAFIEAATGCTC